MRTPHMNGQDSLLVATISIQLPATIDPRKNKTKQNTVVEENPHANPFRLVFTQARGHRCDTPAAPGCFGKSDRVPPFAPTAVCHTIWCCVL